MSGYSFYQGQFARTEHPAQEALRAHLAGEKQQQEEEEAQQQRESAAEALRKLDAAERRRDASAAVGPQLDPGSVDPTFAERRLRLAVEERERQRAVEAERDELRERELAASDRARAVALLERDARVQSAARAALVKREFADTLRQWTSSRKCRLCLRRYTLLESMGRWQCT